MKRNHAFALTIALYFGLFSTLSEVGATLIVDTGVPTQFYYQPSLGIPSSQSQAGEFTIDQPYIITDIQGFIATQQGAYQNGVWIPVTRFLTISIYTDGDKIPRTELFSMRFGVGGSGPNTYFPYGPDNRPAYDWFGPSGLNWYLPTGTYWIAFESRPGDDYVGTTATNPPNPLLKYAISHFPPFPLSYRE